MLSIQAVRGLPRLREPGTVPCIISFSTQLPCFLKSLRTHLFVFFAVHETRRISLSTFISKAPINDTDRATRWNWATKLCWILSKDISRTRLFDYYCYCKNDPVSLELFQFIIKKKTFMADQPCSDSATLSSPGSNDRFFSPQSKDRQTDAFTNHRTVPK